MDVPGAGVSVTVVSCVYGDYFRFLAPWSEAVRALAPGPDDVRIGGDPVGRSGCPWSHPQAFYLQQAIDRAETDWVVIADIDDLLMPDALAGLQDVRADVWQMGYETERASYVVPTLTNAEYLALDHNPYVGTSAIRTQAFREVGGFHDVALQDWELWRRMARAGYTFESSGRTHFHYMRHEATRGATELTMDARAGHLAEMMEAELVIA